MTRTLGIVLAAGLALTPVRGWAQEIQPVPGTTTRDISFTSHDGHPMAGRLTLPDTPGPHPILMLVQTAEAATKDGELRNSKGVRVRVYHQYRELLAPMGIGFFSYEGRGVTANAGGGPVIDRALYDTSTLANKVQDGISAVRTLQKQAGVDGSRIVLRGISEGTMLAAEITAAEFEADLKDIRKLLPAGTPFGTFDKNGDGVYTRDETPIVVAELIEAIKTEDLATFIPWLTAAAAVEVPRTMTESGASRRRLASRESSLTVPRRDTGCASAHRY